MSRMSTHVLGDESQRGQSLGWIPDLCQYAPTGQGSACMSPATHRAAVHVLGAWCQTYLCATHAEALDGVKA